MYDIEYLKRAASLSTVIRSQFDWTKSHADIEAIRNAVGGAL